MIDLVLVNFHLVTFWRGGSSREFNLGGSGEEGEREELIKKESVV